MIEIGQNYGFFVKTLDEMLIHYTELGAIVCFPPHLHGSDTDASSSIIVLQPQWLLGNIAKFLYDSEKHSQADSEILEVVVLNLVTETLGRRKLKTTYTKHKKSF